MTLNRLYNFTPGQTIQSAQVNSEFDQLITTVNTNVLNADFTTNNVVADGNIVTAVSAIDQYLGDNPPGGALAYNSSKNVVLHYNDHASRVIKLCGSDYNKIVLLKNGEAFLENTEVTLTLPSTEAFYDIYVEEETSASPLTTGTKRIKLAYKSAGTTPYSTTADSGQYLIGSTYIYDSRLFGIHSLETPNAPTYHSSTWVTSGNYFDFTLSSQTPSYSTKTSKIPIFVSSAMQYSIQTQYYTSGAGDAWNFTFRILYDDNLDMYSRERVHPLDPSTNVGRTARTYTDRKWYLTPGVHEFKFGGELGDDDASKCNIVIQSLYALYVVYPQNVAFDAD